MYGSADITVRTRGVHNICRCVYYCQVASLALSDRSESIGHWRGDYELGDRNLVAVRSRAWWTLAGT